jgi:predicted nucleic acid-binding protein
LEDDPDLHAKSRRLLEKVRTGDEKAVMLDAVLCECVYVLLKFYKVERPIIAEKLRVMMNYKGLQAVDKETLFEALNIFRDTNLSIVDCLLCAKARREGWTLATFDDELARHSRKKA